MAEWSMAAVLKTVSPKGDVGSNPTPSAMHHVGCMAALNPTWFRAPLKNKMYYVYILRSKYDENLYIGYTTDLKKRFQEHQSGKVVSTKPRRPLELVYYEGHKCMADAERREKYLKTSKGKSSLRLILRDSLK